MFDYILDCTFYFITRIKIIKNEKKNLEGEISNLIDQYFDSFD